MSAETDGVVLEARDITKTYGGTKALKGVNFTVRRGTVTTLFGENGAGKSTLMKILSGVEQPTSGEILLDGKPVVLSSAAEARDLGVSIIHQELSLAPNLSVRDNIFLGRELHGPFGVDYAEEERQTKALLDDMRIGVDPDTLVSDLRVGQQQIIEIARALSIDARILIMDEPTSALTAAEVEVLFGIINSLLARDVAIVYISHHLEEALEITDHAVVLRDGVMTARGERADIDLAWIVRTMVGDGFDLGTPPTGYAFGDVALRLDGLVVRDRENSDRAAVDRVDLEVRSGEIVCLYGLMGAGRTEMLEAVAGREPMASGDILLHGRSVLPLSIAERIAAGIGLVPEDRQRDGLVQTFDVGANLTLASVQRSMSRGTISRRLDTERANALIAAVTVKTPGPDLPIGALSGGNQQKVVIGKILATRPTVMLLDEPSRGIDVGAKGEVFRLLAGKAREGLAVVYSTSEVGECFSIAHRIIVMRRGRISAEFTPEATKDMIMAASGEALT
ncbi:MULTISPECIES: sugar ABC transporter ATP-binding protein [unclassified Microbacterium]|uniref:sugar ABC transporter ATP-binding protein n=1 Tax=unclassified Microbacterium TaxID=2609290 RepID=UPI0016055B96|nr:MULTISPECIES: sugar ABC transporter ATP-binding protein [unclassified Microbacterium]QNA93379.1 sugar ABC transporter ATP-binding protein [Microbacterium sp. Se63.02b]QYM63606.1 sugar ABC transporter ATP-binding protein [Microbacterium sp. Se5.02b]